MESRKSCSRDGHPKGRYTRVWGEESPTPWETPQPPPGDVWSHPVQGIDTLETGRALVHTSPLLSHICSLPKSEIVSALLSKLNQEGHHCTEITNSKTPPPFHCTAHSLKGCQFSHFFQDRIWPPSPHPSIPPFSLEEVAASPSSCPICFEQTPPH